MQAMKNTKLQQALSCIITVLIVLQPLLDIISFWTDRLSMGNALTLALRFLVLAGFGLFGFLLSNRKRVYLAFFAVCLLLLAGHVYACTQRGYRSPFSDLTNFARVAQMPLFALCFIVLIFAHEGLHGLTWGIFAPEHLKSIEFGFIKEYLTPYCTCKETLRRGEYILGLLMPMLLLGILPSLIGVLTGSFFLLGLGLMMILGAGGDFTIFLKILFHRSIGRETLFLDHPTKVGLIVFERY